VDSSLCEDTHPNEDVIEVVKYLALQIVADDRWSDQADEFDVGVFGFILYGYALKVATVFAFDANIAGDVVKDVLTEVLVCSENWATGLVEEARKSAFNEHYHKGQFDLIGIGHSYVIGLNQHAQVDNVFANIAAHRASRIR
jgi:hypothetical protein